MNEKKSGAIPTIYVKESTIPKAYYQAIKAVHRNGYPLRTQYDRKNSDGSYVDPPGKDAKVLIEVTEPFAQPRFPVLSYCERGKYIAEFLGAKDHLVVPYKKLVEMVRSGKEFEPTEWPYCYHQRLTAYPRADSSTINQLEIILDKLAKDPITRRAVAITGVPEVDLFMKSDQPCLREIQLRAIEDDSGKFWLNMHARWRSRDLYKAWGDNLIGITNLQARLARRLSEKIGRDVVVGPYTEENGSLHFYGQDYTEKGLGVFFDKFPTIDSFVERATTSEFQRDALVIPELEELKKEETWKFTLKAVSIIDGLIKDFREGTYLP